MTKKTAYIKTIIIACGIFAESYFLTQSFISYFETQGYFSLNFGLLSSIGLLILGLAYTVSLSAPAWGEWSQFIIVSFPFTLGVYLNLFTLEPANALVISGLAFLILSFFVERAVKLEKVLAKTIPSVFLRPAIRGLLLAVSIVAAGTVLLNPKDHAKDISERIGDLTQQNISQIVGKPMEENPELSDLIDYTSIESNVSDEITNQVETAIEPYRNLLNILMAGLVLATMQGFNAIIFLVFATTINLLFFVAKKIGFIKKDTVMIQKEILKF